MPYPAGGLQSLLVASWPGSQGFSTRAGAPCTACTHTALSLLRDLTLSCAPICVSPPCSPDACGSPKMSPTLAPALPPSAQLGHYIFDLVFLEIGS